VRKVMLDSIDYESENQARVQLNDDTVAEYADAMERKEKLPPIVCYHDGSTYWLADGFHRYHAARKRGEKDTEAQVIKGSRDDARWHAAGANTQHGLKRTTADKQKAVRLALALRPNLSDSKIAKHCGVSDKTVAAQRAKMSGSEIPNLTDQRRLGLDGKMYPARRDSFREEATQSPAEPSDPWHDSDEVEEPAAAPAKRTEAKPEPLRDATGTVVPDEIAEAFQDHKDEVNALLSSLSALKSETVRKDGFDGYHRVQFRIIAAAFDTIASTLRLSALPYAVCPYCGGKDKHCQACRGTGFIGRAHYEVLPPELKRGGVE
jgi:ParB-like chromosome segregation protein Spo0J